MLRTLRRLGIVNDVLLRKFACDCARGVWDMLSRGSKTAVEVTERFCKREAEAHEMVAANVVAAEIVVSLSDSPQHLQAAACSAYVASKILDDLGGYVTSWAAAFDSTDVAADAIAHASADIDLDIDAWDIAKGKAMASHADALRKIFPNPFSSI